MKALLYPLMVFAAVGLGLSTAVHLCPWMGFETTELATGIHAGIFAVWLPTVFVALRLGLADGPRAFSRRVLLGTPGWMRIGGMCLFCYAIVNFGGVLLLPREGPLAEENTLRAFSGNWMAFYGAAFVILYSALRAQGAD